MRTHTALIAGASAALGAAAVLLASFSAPLWTAHAEGPDEEVEPMFEAPARQPQLRCKSFVIELGETVDLPGGEGEVADWVRAQEGYEVWSVDYEAVQKANGYPQHLVQVCLSS